MGYTRECFMKREVDLTNREIQIAERIAWGASGKEVAFDLHISPKTVDNTLRRIYNKIGCGKINELSAWWFCTHFGISFDLSPMARSIVASLLLLIYVSGEIYSMDEFCRYRSKCNRRVRVEYVRGRYKN